MIREDLAQDVLPDDVDLGFKEQDVARADINEGTSERNKKSEETHGTYLSQSLMLSTYLDGIESIRTTGLSKSLKINAKSKDRSENCTLSKQAISTSSSDKHSGGLSSSATKQCTVG